VPSQSNPANLISRGIDPSTLATSTLWWKGPQRLSQEPSSWPTTEFITPTENLEVRKVHMARLQPPEDIMQKVLQAEQAHERHRILQKIHQQLQASQNQQANDHSIHTRS